MLYTSDLERTCIRGDVVLLHEVVPAEREERCAWPVNSYACDTIDSRDEIPRYFLGSDIPGSGFTAGFDIS